MTTLHVWFPACWAPMVAERLFPWSPPEWESTYAHEGRPDSGPPHTTPQTSSWHQPCQGATSSNEPMGDNDSTEVKYKIRQWSLPGATVVPVLNVTIVVSSGWSWMIKLSWIAIWGVAGGHSP